jgi:peptide/nickel transport system permease protein
MARWLLGRILHAGAVLLGAATLVFLLVHAAGDPIDGLAPPGSSPADRAALARAFGLDQPLPEQYVRFVARAATGDFGESWRQGRPALVAVLERLPATLMLAGGATLVAAVAGTGLGLAAGARVGGRLDGVARAVAMLGQAVPAFWLGSLLILLFAVRLRWLPSSGFDGPASLILPVLTLAAFPLATTMRLVRAGVAGSLGADWVRTARSKGLSERRVLSGHVLRNALLPALAFTGFQAAFLLSGAAIVEAVFAWPGIGTLALGAAADRDLPVIQAFVAVVAVLLVAINLLVDAAGRWLDPRLRAGVAG